LSPAHQEKFVRQSSGSSANLRIEIGTWSPKFPFDDVFFIDVT
jgi:hypothetical protein